jgi:hypothetical protein
MWIAKTPFFILLLRKQWAILEKFKTINPLFFGFF